MSDEKTVAAIRDILIASDAVRCDVDSYEPTLYASKLMYHIPTGHCVQVDFNKLAAAIYKAGYRKEEKKHDPVSQLRNLPRRPTLRVRIQISSPLLNRMVFIQMASALPQPGF